MKAPGIQGLAVHHVALRTQDVAGVCAFYHQVLDLPVVRVQPNGSHWLAMGQAVLMVEPATPREPAVPSGTLDLLALAVDPAGRAAVRQRLEALGVPVESETDFTTYFRDPDGRRVAVSTHPLTASTD